MATLMLNQVHVVVGSKFHDSYGLKVYSGIHRWIAAHTYTR